MNNRERSIMSSFDFKKRTVQIGYALMLLALLALAVTMLYPFATTVFSSFKTNQEIFTFPPSLFPHQFQWSNYVEGFKYVNLIRPFLNTLLLFGGNAVISLMIVSLAAFSLSQMKLPFRKGITIFIMSTLMIPSATYMIPNFLNLQSLGLIDSYWAFWLPAGASAFNIMLLRSFFDGINKELFEAGRLDGASEFRCFFRLAIPMSVPVFSTLLIFAFTSTWNDWFWPSLVLTSPEKYPLATVVYRDVIQSFVMTWNVKFSVLTVIMLPPLLFFLFFQKNIMHGLNLSGVKG
ncbi:carbohydrate ABC transporter permease [Paenibacillus motobuensis]|uniref:carbohydrate ABC transporter permease n=1 Tax=Paenibacillus TaxID=44249 RepID=UPI00203D981B|nr:MULTISPECIES: carbohydrate ABC transporter permease [Paenibacillus]MCM3040798.1 carbohydrate ABC transporter permease [Paenibacillus lutimineralis]MCM3647902.1 carbohydrate ABC transporter permease [Paenibacillus motobuensis]